MANEMAVNTCAPDWKRRALVQGEITQCVNRDLREYVENLAEARVSLRERDERIGQLERYGDLNTKALVRMQETLDRAQNLLRFHHLTVKPKHKRRLRAKDASLATGDKNSLAEAWCPTCALILEMDGGVR